MGFNHMYVWVRGWNVIECHGSDCKKFLWSCVIGLCGVRSGKSIWVVVPNGDGLPVSQPPAPDSPPKSPTPLTHPTPEPKPPILPPKPPPLPPRCQPMTCCCWDIAPAVVSNTASRVCTCICCPQQQFLTRGDAAIGPQVSSLPPTIPHAHLSLALAWQETC